MSGEGLIGLGIVLVILGIILLLVGILISALSGTSRGEESGEKTEVGGVVIIGPIPIIFGSSGKAALMAAVLGTVIMILAIILYVMARQPPA